MISNDFNPSIKHSLYFIRKGLLGKITEYSYMLTGKLLDFGCGAKPYKSLFTNASEYIGLDYDSEGHSHANEQVDVFYDGKTIPFGPETFDSVFSSEVFEHIFTLNEILPELNRVLRKEGMMLITCPFAWEEHEIPVDYARYTQFALRDMLEKNGFKIIKIDKNGHFMLALHQLFVLYLNDHWSKRVFFFSKFTIFGKIVRHTFIPLLNGLFLLTGSLWPKSDRMYLNTIVVAQKI